MSDPYRLLLELPPDKVGMFRFLIEAYDNLAMFTVLDRRIAIVKVICAPEGHPILDRALAEIARSLPMREICHEKK